MLHPTIIREFMVIYRNLSRVIQSDFDVQDRRSLGEVHGETLILYQHTLVVSSISSNIIRHQ